MSVLIAQIGCPAGSSVPIALGMPWIVIIAVNFALFLCVPGVLLGIWATARDKPTPWRFVGVVVVIVGLVCLQKIPGFDFLHKVEELALPLLLMVVATSLSLFIGRMAGVRLERVSRRSSSAAGGRLERVSRRSSSNLAFRLVRLEQGLEKIDNAAEPPKLQFLLWSLLSWTTAFAVLLCSFSTLRAVVPSCVPLDADSWMAVVVNIAVISPAVLVALWIALADRWLVARIVVLVLGLAIWENMLELSPARKHFHLPDFLTELTIVCVITALLMGSLLVLRLTGHRMVWRKPAVWSLFRGARRRI